MSEPIHKGGCLCGQLRFEAKGAPSRVALCHCEMCRKHTGAPFVALAVYPTNSVTIIGGTYGYRSSERIDRRGCSQCKAPIYIVSEESDEVEIYTGAMDDPKPFSPDYEIFNVHRPEWLPKIGDIPTHKGFRQ